MPRVLVVDDEGAILRAVERMFRRAGYDVRTARSAAEALVILDEFTPDAVVSDQRMPGMPGVELLAIVKVRFPAAKRVLLSGYAQVEGACDAVFLSKPYVPAELMAACR